MKLSFGECKAILATIPSEHLNPIFFRNWGLDKKGLLIYFARTRLNQQHLVASNLGTESIANLIFEQV
ncbi:MAG: hypothetical protein Q7J68_07290 [Thermoplasmata archaeon]|nr:hypothetical protein [Thermoplasmata archaeon]